LSGHDIELRYRGWKPGEAFNDNLGNMPRGRSTSSSPLEIHDPALSSDILM
jgi:hypothetical protein